MEKQHKPMTRTYTGPGFVRGSNNTIGRVTTNGGLSGREFGRKPDDDNNELEEIKKRIKKRPGKLNDHRPPVAKRTQLKMRTLPRPQPGPIKEGVNEDELDPNQRALLRRMRSRKAS